MKSILSFVGGETVSCSLSNLILGMYCKGAVGSKKSDKILPGLEQKEISDFHFPLLLYSMFSYFN